MNRKARTTRCYTEQTLSAAGEIVLDKRGSHHLSTVMRARAGTAVELFNGDGNNYSGEIVAVGKKTIVAIERVRTSDLESKLQLTLVQSIARGDKMDSIVQKATELGVSTLQPIYTKHSIAALDDKREARKLDHWQAIIVSACEQCGRCILPTLHTPVSLQEYLNNDCRIVDGDDIANANGKQEIQSNHMEYDQRWILSPRAQAGNMTNSKVASAALLVGPESGFDDDEIQAGNAAGFTDLQIGPRVLRTETAGPAAIALLQARFGDMC